MPDNRFYCEIIQSFCLRFQSCGEIAQGEKIAKGIFQIVLLLNWDSEVIFEDFFGKVRHIGLSEASAKTIRRAHAVHPIARIRYLVREPVQKNGVVLFLRQ